VINCRLDSVDWMHPVNVRNQWQAFMKTINHFLFPYQAEDNLSSLVILSFSRRNMLHAIRYLDSSINMHMDK
jgi:hypothetical protein